MNETRRKPTTGRQPPSLCDKWHGIFYMPSRIDEAGHAKAFDYPVAEHWGKSEMFSSAGGTRTYNTSVRSRTCYQLSHPGSPRGSHNPGPSTGGGIFSQLGGLSVKNSNATRRPSPWGRIPQKWGIIWLYSKFGLKSQMADSRHLGFPGHRLFESKK